MLAIMTGTFRVREIAAQAGLSEATVDRVLHGRGGVRASTVEEVHQALPGPIMARPSSVQVITPYNMPAALLPG